MDNKPLGIWSTALLVLVLTLMSNPSQSGIQRTGPIGTLTGLFPQLLEASEVGSPIAWLRLR